MLAEAQNLRRAGEEFANDQLGTLTIAATHTQARYALPKAVAASSSAIRRCELRLHQGNPTQICEQVLAGEADLGVATEAIALYPELVSLPVYQWNRCVVVPPKHPLLKATPLTLEALARVSRSSPTTSPSPTARWCRRPSRTAASSRTSC